MQLQLDVTKSIRLLRNLLQPAAALPTVHAQHAVAVASFRGEWVDMIGHYANAPPGFQSAMTASEPQ